MKISVLIALFAALAPFGFSQPDRCPDGNPNAVRQLNPFATGVFGHPRLTPITSRTPNFVEGRELYQPYAVAIDTSSSPQPVYVSDSSNNRVLAWRDRNAFNRGDAADLVIGQRDMFSTEPKGPTTDIPGGVTFPGGLATDSSGNLYVIDVGNNRILRYPSPFRRSDFSTPDLIIGQRTLRSGGLPNQGLSAPSASTIFTASGATGFQTKITFDASGNLWLADTGNNRVLRYPVGQLAPNTSEPAADMVVGQIAFTTNSLPQGSLGRWSRNVLFRPVALAFSQAGDLYVSDQFNNSGRVLYFRGPVANFTTTATRLLGIPSPTPTELNPIAFNGCPVTGPKERCDIALGSLSGANPEGLAVFNNQLFVADPGNHRVVKFDSPDRWPTDCNFTSPGPPCAASTAISPTGILFVGQIDGFSVAPNRGQREPGPNSLSSPQTLAFADTDLYVADTGNNRVLVFPVQTGGAYVSANKVLGQMDFSFNAVNLVDDRGLYVYEPSTRLGAGGVIVDTTGDTPHLYIADFGNNRVLGFRDARRFRSGGRADIVIGQIDFSRTVRNFGTNDLAVPSDTSLAAPTGLAVDASGNLYVADTGNARVLRFPRPFDQVGIIRANLVLGQPTFNTNPANSNPGPNTMQNPWGLVFTASGNLLVSDTGFHRVAMFTKPAGGDFTNGQTATTFFGQPDGNTFTAGPDTNQMNSPRGIALDSSDRLYVADTNNNRVMVFTGVNTNPRNPRASFTQAISSPFAVAVGFLTGEIWITNGGNALAIRFPIFEQWSLNPTQALTQLQTAGTIAMALDSFENPILVDTTNRVAFHYTRASVSNGASFVSGSSAGGGTTHALTPGMIAYVCRVGLRLNHVSDLVQHPEMPWPTTLADTQVMVNGVASPILYVNFDRVAFQVPVHTPIEPADIQVARVSTGEILASATIAMDVSSPAFFTCPSADGNGPICASNQDGSINSFSNQAARGSFISLYGTGIGFVNNAPPDGVAAAGLAPADEKPFVALNPGVTGGLASADIQYFGLVNWAPGVFQLNIRIPDTVPPNNQVLVGIVFRGKSSTGSDTTTLLRTWISVK